MTRYRRSILMIATVSALAGAARAARAQQDTTLPQLDSPIGRRLTWAVNAVQPGATPEPSDVFVPAFFERIPRSAVLDALRDVADQTGGLRLISIEESAHQELRAAARAKIGGAWWRILINVEDQPPYGITRLSYNEAPELGAPDLPGWGAFDSLLDTMPGTTVFAAYSVDGDQLRPLLLHNAATPVAIGSVFKLWVLGALAELVDQGGASWTDTLAIRDEWKSLPSGRMQDLPEGETRSLADFAQAMISISDNTATDHLINRIGRTRVEDYARRHGSPPGMNTPFLTTYELFKLKINAGDKLMADYVGGGPAVRRAILDGAVASLPLPDAAQEPEEPTAIDHIEWFASASALAELMVELANLGRQATQQPVWDALTRNAGFNWDRTTWPVVAYKGGSEAGVVCLTWLLERSDGQRFVTSIGVNDQSRALDHTTIIIAVASAGKLLEREDGRTVGTP
ncbi:MAG: hypothetical protein GTO22_03610 [Gemmatimonadales bacterium]|nr:hypothetical protein [Gemmatimonadales bacterium]